MKITHCKLKKSTQRKLLEFFVPEVTARAATVFSILKRQGKVFTVVVENTKTETLLPVIKRKTKPDSWVYTDIYRNHNVLDVSEFHHERINHSELFAVKQNHINGIENF